MLMERNPCCVFNPPIYIFTVCAFETTEQNLYYKIISKRSKKAYKSIPLHHKDSVRSIIYFMFRKINKAMHYICNAL